MEACPLEGLVRQMFGYGNESQAIVELKATLDPVLLIYSSHLNPSGSLRPLE
jgi:hypothetical protein